MFRTWSLFLFVAIVALGQSTDPAFDNVPFDRWLKEERNAKIDWSLSVSAPILTELQRLLTSVTATVAGDSLTKRQYSGPMLLFLEARDRQKRRYRTHLLLTLPEGTDYAAGGRWTEDICVVPGDYEIAAAIFDTESKEHSLRRMKLRVPELHRDPLPGAWSGLPTLENGGPACYDSRLRLPLTTGRPVQIDLIINTPVDARTGIGARLMVVSELEVSNGSMTGIALDLENRKVREQKVVGRLDPNSFLGPLPNDSRYLVNAHALDIDNEGAQFFVSEIRKRVELVIPGAQHVLIIVSDRKSSAKGEKLDPIQATPAAGTRVFYVRCSLPPFDSFRDRDYFLPRVAIYIPVPPNSGVDGTVSQIPWSPPPPRPDSLERTLDPLQPQLFDVTSPLEFRHALAQIISEISRL
jgi:hypothetical protein